MNTFVKTKTGFQVYNKEGAMFFVDSKHPYFEGISKLLVDVDKEFFDFELLFNAVKPLNVLKKMLGESIEISLEEGSQPVVKFKGLEIPPRIQERLLLTIRNIMQGQEISEIFTSDGIPEELNPVILFIENLMKNPSRSSVNELYSFLEVCSLPITSDGCFLAYKKVKANYLDIYSGTFLNEVGKTLSMERWEVDDDRNRTCSAGFHVCSFEYLDEYGSSNVDLYKVMVVKVNPADVVSVPSDYNNQKMRVCTYSVVDEIPMTARIAGWYLPKVLEGKTAQIIGTITAALSHIAKAVGDTEMIENIDSGVNFDQQFPVFHNSFNAAVLFFDALFLNLEKELGFEVDFSSFDPDETEITINSVVNYITRRII